MQANVRLGGGETTNVLLVPKEAVLDNEGKKIVYVLRSGEEFERRDVVVGDEYGDKVAILSGVKAGRTSRDARCVSTQASGTAAGECGRAHARGVSGMQPC